MQFRTTSTSGITLLAVALLGACTSGGGNASPEVASLGTDPVSSVTPDSSDAPTASAPTDPEEAMLAYTECMRDHGIDMADPTAGDGGIAMRVDVDEVDGEEFEDAEKECSPLLGEAIGEPDIDPEQEAQMREEMLAYTECMRDKGFDMPDPVFDDSGAVHIDAENDGGALPAEPDEDFIAASEECGVGVEFSPVDTVGS